MGKVLRIALFLSIVVPFTATSGSALATSVHIRNGKSRTVARFRVTYSGSASVRTRYHSEPPNPGGMHDTNDAIDSSTWKWSLTWRTALRVPRCGRTAHRRDPCRTLKQLAGVTGPQQGSGRVSHRHVDGLFPADNASIHCQLHSSTPKGFPGVARILLRYNARAKTLALTALDPLTEAIGRLPGQCPGQGDSIDGLNDNYFTPGFSFSQRYGPDRFFTSATSVIKLRTWHRARTITIRLRNTRQNTPPRNCAVPFPAYQRCTTTESWSGTLRLQAIR
jgi:hypothetical protein